jgi:lipoprotein signal peptidase
MGDRLKSFFEYAQVRTKVHKKTRVNLYGLSMILGGLLGVTTDRLRVAKVLQL